MGLSSFNKNDGRSHEEGDRILTSYGTNFFFTSAPFEAAIYYDIAYLDAIISRSCSRALRLVFNAHNV